VQVLPGGRCDTQKGLDCVGESHCFYGICVCLYGLVIVGHECANADVLKPVPPGGICSQGQQCQGRARCVRGKCQCPRCVCVINPPNQTIIQGATTRFRIASLHQVRHPRTANKQAASPFGSGGAHSLSDPVECSANAKVCLHHPGSIGRSSGGWQIQSNPDCQSDEHKLDGPTIVSFFACTNGSAEQAIIGQCWHWMRRVCCRISTDCFCNGSATCLVTSPPMVASSTQVPPAFHTQFFASSTEPASFQGLPGHLCSPQQQCHGGAICLGGFCVCRPGFRPMEGFCQIAKVGLGQPCFINVVLD